MKRTNMKNKKIIPAVLAGTVAGAILGVLFAPQTGKQTREELRADCKDFFAQLKAKKQVSEWDEEPVEEKAIPNV